MKKIKLLVDARVIGGEGQGSATYIKGIYNALMDLYGEHYEIFFSGYHKQAVVESFLGKIDEEHFISMKKEMKLIQFYKTYPKIIENYKIDFAHFQYIIPFVKNSKTIVTTHDLLFNDFPTEFKFPYRLQRNYLFKRSARLSDIRLTVSNYSRDAINRHYKIDPTTIKVTANAVHKRFLEPYNKLDSINYIASKHQISNYILYVSRIEPRKNHELLLKAYCRLELWKKNIPLVFIGNNTANSRYLDSLLTPLPLEITQNIHWIKYVSDKDLFEFYRAANLFVYPSKAEGFGIPPLEATALKINTICSNSTAMKDFTFLGDNQFDPNEFDDFCALLQQNILYPPSNDVLEERVVKMRKNYSWNKGATILHREIMKHSGRSVRTKKTIEAISQ